MTKKIEPALTEIPTAPDGSAARVLYPIGGAAPQRGVNPFNSKITIFNRVLGDNIGDDLLRVRGEDDALLFSRAAELEQHGVLRLTPRERHTLVAVGEGRTMPLSQRQADVVRSFRAMDDADAAFYSQQGVQVSAPGGLRPFKAIPNHMPHYLNPVKVAHRPVQQVQASIHRANPTWTAQEAADMAVALRARALGQGLPPNLSPRVVTLLSNTADLPGHLHQRANWIMPDDLMVDGVEAVTRYLQDSARERALVTVFGPNAQRVEQAFERAAQVAHPKDLELAREAWSQFQGRPGTFGATAEFVGQVGRIGAQSVAASLLGVTTAVKQLSQLAPAFAQLPVQQFTRGLFRAFSRGGRFEAHRAGALTRDMLTDALVTSRPPLPTARRMDMIERTTRRAATANVRFSGINVLDDFARNASYHGSRFDLFDLRTAAQAGNQRAAGALAQHGLSAASPAGAVEKVAKSFADKVNIRVDMIELPHILTTPGYAWARSLSTFAIGMNRLVWNSFLLPALRGNPRPLLKLLAASGVAGEAIGTIVRNMQGRPDDRVGGGFLEFYGDLAAGRVPPRTMLVRYADDLAWAGTMGLAQGFLGAMGLDIGTLARPGTVSERQGRLLGTLGGATVGRSTELVAQIPNIPRAVTGETEEQRASARGQLLRTAVRGLPVVGGLVAGRIPTEYADRRRATEAMVRAIRRKDRAEVMRWSQWFSTRHPGKSISDQAIQNALGR